MGFQERPEFWLHWSSGFGPLTAPTCPTMRFAASRWARQECWCWCALLNSRIPRDLTREIICMWTFAYCWQPPKQVGTLLFGWMGRKESEQTCVWPLLVRFGEQFVWHFDKETAVPFRCQILTHERMSFPPDAAMHTCLPGHETLTLLWCRIHSFRGLIAR